MKSTFTIILLLVTFYFSFFTNNSRAKSYRNQTGEFDYLVLSLSWSPQFCAEGNNQARNPVQCNNLKKQNPRNSKINKGFIIHGLWPQFIDGGFPQYCGRVRLTKKQIALQKKIFVSKKLLLKQWNKHGSCFDTEPDIYFDALEQAFNFANLIIPDELTNPTKANNFTVDKLVTKFIKTSAENHINLSADNIVIQCSRGGRFLREVRICVNKDITDKVSPRICDERLLAQTIKTCRRKSFIVRPF